MVINNPTLEFGMIAKQEDLAEGSAAAKSGGENDDA
jgi:hypothetical protein